MAPSLLRPPCLGEEDDDRALAPRLPPLYGPIPALLLRPRLPFLPSWRCSERPRRRPPRPLRRVSFLRRPRQLAPRRWPRSLSPARGRGCGSGSGGGGSASGSGRGFTGGRRSAPARTAALAGEGARPERELARHGVIGGRETVRENEVEPEFSFPAVTPHKCHYGACPPCKLTCGEELSCGHTCKERCHGPISPPNPEFTLKPTKKKMGKQIECTPGTPCPSCKEVVLVPCFGQHLGQERAMPCCKWRPFPCENLCGNPLLCGNHYCTKSCHVLEVPLNQPEGDRIASISKVNALAEPCEQCNLPCQRGREPPCSHPCPLPCHLSDCPSCKVLVKKPCHCGAMVHAFECVYFNNLNAKEQIKVRTCGGPCHRKLPNCPHLCSEVCHPGICPSVDQCMKKVNARCACNTLKQEWLCQDVLKEYRKSCRDPKEVPKSQFGVGLLACSEDCKKKLKAPDSELHLRKSQENKSPAVEVINVPKRKKRRDRGQEVKISKFQEVKTYALRVLLIILLSIIVAVGLYLLWKGIFWLSDWMNEMGEQRARQRHRMGAML